MIDDTVFDFSHKKRYFTKIKHLNLNQWANLNDSDKKTEFVFEEKDNYYQTSNVYLELELTLNLNGDIFDDDNTGTTRL